VLDKTRAQKFTGGIHGEAKPKYAKNDDTDLRKLTDPQRKKILLDLGASLETVWRGSGGGCFVGCVQY
jgi:hypothetical protein